MTALANNQTQFAEPWVPEPNSRGTWSVLYSCLFTLTLCVWSAIHLNIPPRGEPRNVQLRRKVKWVFTAIFAPEFVVYSAWQQYNIAKQFSDDLDILRRKQEGISPLPTQSRWREFLRYFKSSEEPELKSSGEKGPEVNGSSQAQDKKSTESQELDSQETVSLTYGYYVVMGGLIVDVSEVYDNVSWMTMTPKSVLDLAQQSSWKHFYVRDEVIKDKSKADHLAKLLVLCQVSWAVLQCISRHAAGYPLTVLEVHVLVHALCAMTMYILWFSKPLDIRDPTVIDINQQSNRLALLLMRTTASAYRPSTNHPFPSHLERLITLAQLEDPATEAECLLFDVHRTTSAQEQCPTAKSDHDNGVISIQENIDASLATGVVHETEPHPRLSEVIRDKGDDADIESAITLRPLRSLTDFAHSAAPSRVPPPGVAIAQTITTGQTLSSGVGPNALILAPKDAPRRWSTRGPFVDAEKSELVEVNERLKPLLPLQEYQKEMEGRIYCKFAISLSQKDLLRWQRAARAFAQELSDNREVSSSDSNSPQHDSGAQPDPSETNEGSQQLKNEPARLRCLGEVSRGFHIDTNVVYDMNDSNFVTRSTNIDITFFPRLLLADSEEGRLALAGIFAIPAMYIISGAYAGIHLALWNYTFPTRVEALLWKIASCTLSAPVAVYIGGLVVISNAVALALYLFFIWPYRGIRRLVGRASEQEDPVNTEASTKAEGPDRMARLKNFVKKIWANSPVFRATVITFVIIPLGFVVVVIGLAVLGAALLYALARVYIIVEAIISLRRVPVGVYEQVSWSQYIPHL